MTVATLARDSQASCEEVPGFSAFNTSRPSCDELFLLLPSCDAQQTWFLFFYLGVLQGSRMMARAVQPMLGCPPPRAWSLPSSVQVATHVFASLPVTVEVSTWFLSVARHWPLCLQARLSPSCPGEQQGLPGRFCLLTDSAGTVHAWVL